MNPLDPLDNQASASNSITRRSFMKKTALTAGAVTLLGQGIGLASGSSSYVVGSIVTDPGVKVYSTSWWYKPKITISSPNPGTSVTVTVVPAGAEMGPYSEETGPIVTIEGKIDSTGAFVPSKNSAVGFVSAVAIGYLPGFPVSTSPVDAKIRVTGYTENSSEIIMTGVVWAESSPTLGSTAKTSEDQWEVKVARQ